MLKEEYESAVDELAGTPIEAIVFGLGDGRTPMLWRPRTRSTTSQRIPAGPRGRAERPWPTWRRRGRDQATGRRPSCRL